MKRIDRDPRSTIPGECDIFATDTCKSDSFVLLPTAFSPAVRGSNAAERGRRCGPGNTGRHFLEEFQSPIYLNHWYLGGEQERTSC